MSWESRVQVCSDEQTTLILLQVSMSFRDLLVIDMHIQSAHYRTDFLVLDDRREIHQVDKNVILWIL